MTTPHRYSHGAASQGLKAATLRRNVKADPPIQRRSAAEARLRDHERPTATLTHAQIEALVTDLRGMIDQVFAMADPEDKVAAYEALGLRLTYHPNDKAVLVEARPDTAMCVGFVSEGVPNRSPGR